jgi:hypothetical protein
MSGIGATFKYFIPTCVTMYSLPKASLTLSPGTGFCRLTRSLSKGPP